MAKPKLVEFFRNILVLATLVGLVLVSWLFGHILRYSIPALWHPPLQDTDPQIKVGVEFELDGIRRLAAFTGFAVVNASSQNQPPSGLGAHPAPCVLELAYYTSLPAKCRTVDGRLVSIREADSSVVLIPGVK